MVSDKFVTYKELQAELEKIMAKLESPDIDIEEATLEYERGIQIARLLKERLAKAENKIKIISQKNK